MIGLGGSLWAIMTILGPIVLGAVILWAILHNRTSPAQKHRTEATARMYDEQNVEDRLHER